ncbi:hypothetical protein TNCV_3276891 [Trichonephila clavipes]|nr:hypothetical protein TNCV_3276891 [Trichonephila clavipes]
MNLNGSARSPDLTPIEHEWDITGRSFADPTPLVHADASRDVFPRGAASREDRGRRTEVGRPRPPPGCSPSKLGWNRAKSYCHLHGAQS